jgi:amidophosphoribosyltransferase
MLREAGALEIHMRVSSSPIKHPCFYGVDFGTYEELIAARLTIEGIRESLGVDSLHYLSVPGMVKSTGLPHEEFCLACFNAEYPVELPTANGALGKYSLTNGALNGELHRTGAELETHSDAPAVTTAHIGDCAGTDD